MTRGDLRLGELGVADAAGLAGSCPETIRRAIRSGELLAKRHPTDRGHPFRIFRTDLAAFLQKRSKVN